MNVSFLVEQGKAYDGCSI